MYPVLSKPGTHILETMYHIPQARNHVLSTLATMHFHKKFNRKVELLQQCAKIKVKSLSFQYNTT